MNRHDGLKCFVEDGVMTIQVGVEMIAYAAKLHPDLAEPGQGEWIEPEITDADTFAEEVRRQLIYEEEDGSSTIQRALEDAILEAVENGAEGIKTAGDIIRERRQGSAEPSETSGMGEN